MVLIQCTNFKAMPASDTDGKVNNLHRFHESIATESGTALPSFTCRINLYSVVNGLKDVWYIKCGIIINSNSIFKGVSCQAILRLKVVELPRATIGMTSLWINISNILFDLDCILTNRLRSTDDWRDIWSFACAPRAEGQLFCGFHWRHPLRTISSTLIRDDVKRITNKIRPSSRSNIDWKVASGSHCQWKGCQWSTQYSPCIQLGHIYVYHKQKIMFQSGELTTERRLEHFQWCKN